MRSRRLIWLIAIVAALAWPAWIASRWETARRIYADPDDPALSVTPQHIEALRKLQFAWNTRIESGGPEVDPLTPYGSPDLAADLSAIIGSNDRAAIARFHREVSALLIWALHNCDLAEGRYRLAHLDNAAMEQRLRRDLTGLPEARINAVMAELPRLAPDGMFDFTRRHLLLLHEMRFEWPDSDVMWIVAGTGYPVPAIHFKRPFGDMTAFEIDMAAIVGLPRPDTNRVDPVLERLYWEMWPALQTFVQYVKIDAGHSSCAGK
ncbi:hypothetical protein IC762_19535 [Bradyrhizobium genosp. L]|uniref:hypothetical protein n=1 Tax=Bradyrhizobium genosp. L TaxID=83637 RepID=UPI0018A2C24D|nr:hypothetical protein [Bradyrhizobium genosp. L]QPF81988.1 hypothetical protein IC762_19535 [Bradyrhizobium genosp. L]